jgi:hypothetical protein
MCGREVFDMDVVAYAGAVGSREVGSEDRQVGTLPTAAASHLDEQRGRARRLADSALRIGARDVEVAQGDDAAAAETSRSIHSDISFCRRD